MPLSVAISSPGVLCETIIEVICNVSTRFPPGLVLETFHVNLHGWLIVHRQNVFKILNSKLSLLFLVWGDKTKVNNIVLLQLHILVGSLGSLNFVFVNGNLNTIIIRVIIRTRISSIILLNWCRSHVIVGGYLFDNGSFILDNLLLLLFIIIIIITIKPTVIICHD